MARKKKRPPPEAAPDAGRPRTRRAAALFAGLAGVAALAGGAWILFRNGSQPPGPPSPPRAAPHRLPSPPPLEPPPFVPPHAIRWPAVDPSRMGLFEEGTRSLEAAARLYAGGDRARGDALMLEALEKLRQAGALVPALSAYYHETVMQGLKERRYAEVAPRIDAWLLAFPGEPYALWLAANVRYRLGRFEEALEAAERLARLRPGDIALALLEAECNYELGRQEACLEALDRALSGIGFPAASAWDHPLAERVLRAAYRMLHRFQEYRRLLEVARFFRRRFPGELETVIAEGVARLETGDAAGALPLLRRGLEHPGNRDEVRFALARALHRLEKWREAAAALGELLAESPYFDRAYYQLGLNLARLGLAEEARAFFEEARAMRQVDAERRRARDAERLGERGRAAALEAKVWRSLGEYARAESVLRRAAATGDPAALIPLAEFLLDCLRVGGALEVLSQAERRIGPRHPDVLGNRARALRLGGAREDALKLLSEAAESEGASEAWLALLARWLTEKGRAEEALERLKPRLVQGADRALYVEAASAALESGRPELALEYLAQVSRGDRRWVEWEAGVLLARAIALSKGNLEEASRLLEEVPPRRRGTLRFLKAEVEVLEAELRARGSTRDASPELPARLEAAQKRLHAALADLPRLQALTREAASTPWPRSGPLHIGIGELLRKRGDFPRAVHHGRIALWAQPKSEAAMRFLLSLLTEPGDVYRRIALLRRLREVRPGDASVREELARLEARWVRFESD